MPPSQHWAGLGGLGDISKRGKNTRHVVDVQLRPKPTNLRQVPASLAANTRGIIENKRRLITDAIMPRSYSNSAMCPLYRGNDSAMILREVRVQSNCVMPPIHGWDGWEIGAAYRDVSQTRGVLTIVVRNTGKKLIYVVSWWRSQITMYLVYSTLSATIWNI